MNAIVLGAREGNIGQAIVDKIESGEAGNWRAVGTDCHAGHGTLKAEGVPGEMYIPASADSLSKYDACIITLGVTHIEPFGKQTSADIAKVLRGSLELPLICVKNYVKGRGGQGGIIVFIGSYAHDHPLTHSTTYCVAKAGLDMACRSLAWELMPEFRVHIIHPHHVSGTPMSAQVRRHLGDEADTHLRKDLRMPDILNPEEVAEMVAFLLTNPAAAWTSGTGINLYGGMR